MEPSPVFDLIIVGAGPAGLGAAYAAQQKKLRYRVLEAGKIVNTIHDFPLGKTLFSEPEELELEKGTLRCANEHPTREETIDYFTNFVKERHLDVESYHRVENICKRDDLFEVYSQKSLYRSRQVIVCTGINAVPRRLGVSGEDLPKTAYKFRKPEPYRQKRTLVVGGGDSALETALSLCQVAAEVSLSYRRARFLRPQPVNLAPFVEKVQAGLIKVFFETVVREIRSESVILAKNGGGEEELANDFVFLMTGTEPALDFLARIGVEIRGRLPVYDEETYESRIAGLYLAGHITKQRFIKSALAHGPQIVRRIDRRP